ncbi:MAG TPA: GNAT family N-acetyltransferase [Gemmatimonadaceae bacterium]|jgi:N-acetylglutamate synthase-like GNAT family acetyltransferase
MKDRIVEFGRDDLVLSTDRSRLDVDMVLEWLLASHWGAAMTRELLDRAIENSVCFAVYRGDEQLSFARAVTDLATYAYLTDVIVAVPARGRGLGKWMMEAVVAHPDLQGLRRIALWTRDARTLYEQFGFTTVTSASTYMELRTQR